MADSGERISDILSRLTEREITFQEAAQSLRAASDDRSVPLSRDDQHRLLEPLLNVLSSEQFEEINAILKLSTADSTLDVTIASEDVQQGTTLDPSNVDHAPTHAFRPIPEAHRYRRVKTITRPNGAEYWLAKDLNAQRDVLLQPAGSDRHHTLAAGQLVGGLEHPNIAPVYSIIPGGDDAGVIYRFNEGTPLSEWIAAAPVTPLALRQSLNMVVSLCDALAYAHSKQIAHGSVKAENVVVGDFHEIQLESWEDATADTTADVMHEDIRGILDIVNDITGHFRNTPHVPKAELRLLERFIISTPSNGDSSRFQTVKALRNDLIAWLHRTPLHHVSEPYSYRCMRFLLKYRKAVIASLVLTIVAGATFLYAASGVRDARLLLNQTNFRLEQRHTALADQITELSTAIEEAATEEERATAATNAADQQERLLIKETKADDIAAEELRLATLELSKQTAISTIASKQASLDAEKAQEAANAAKTARNELNTRQYESNEVQAQDAITDATRLLSNDEPTSALVRLVFAADLIAANPQTPRTIALNNQIDSRINGILRKSPVPGLVIPIDGETLAIRFDNQAHISTRVVSKGKEGFIETLRTDNTAKPARFKIEPGATQASISTNLQFVSVLHVNDTESSLNTYSVADQALIHTINSPDSIDEIRISNAGDTAFTTSPETLSLLTRDGELFADAVQHASRISEFAFSTDSSRIATTSADKTARVWETSSALPLTDEINHPTSVESCTFAGNNTLLTIAANGSAFRWDVSTYNPVGGFFTGPSVGYKNRVNVAAWTNTRDELAICTTNNYLHVYRNDRQLRFQPRRFSHPLTSVRFSTDSRLLILTDQLGQVHLINSQSGESLRHPTPPYSKGTSLAISKNNDRLILHCGNLLQVWDLYLSVTSPRIESLPFTPTSFLSSGFTGDLVVIGDAGECGRLSLETDGITPMMQLSLGSLDLSPPLQVLRTGIDSILTDTQHRVYIFSADAIPKEPITQHAGPITGFSISADGRYLASASKDRTIHLIDLRTGDRARRLDWFGAPVQQAVFLNESLLYVESQAKSNAEMVIRQIYDINTTKLLNLPTSQNYSTTVSPLSPTLAAYVFVTNDQSIPTSHIQCFQSETGILQQTYTLSGEITAIQCVDQHLFVITRDGRMLRIGLEEDSIKLVGRTHHPLTDLAHSKADGLLVLYYNSGVSAFYNLDKQHFEEISTSGSGVTQLLRNDGLQHPIVFDDTSVRIFPSALRSRSMEVALSYLSSIGVSNSDQEDRQSSIAVLSHQTDNATKNRLRFDWIKQNTKHMPIELAIARFELLDSGNVSASTEQLVTAAVNAEDWTRTIQLLDESLQRKFSFRHVFLKSAFLRMDDKQAEADLYLRDQLAQVATASPADKLLFLNAVALSQNDRTLHEAAYKLYTDSPSAVKNNVMVVRAAALLSLRLSDTTAFESLHRQLQSAPNKIVLAPLNALALSVGKLESTSAHETLSRLANRLPFTHTHNLKQLSPELLLFELIYKSLETTEAIP